MTLLTLLLLHLKKIVKIVSFQKHLIKKNYGPLQNIHSIGFENLIAPLPLVSNMHQSLYILAFINYHGILTFLFRNLRTMKQRKEKMRVKEKKMDPNSKMSWLQGWFVSKASTQLHCTTATRSRKMKNFVYGL